MSSSVSEQYRCLVEILTCLLCRSQVQQAHACPNCSKFYCLDCIIKELCYSDICPHCQKQLRSDMLTNCTMLCTDLKLTLDRVKKRENIQEHKQLTDKNHKCIDHKLQKGYYCQTCQISLCPDCSVLSQQHRGHHFIKLAIIKGQYQQKTSIKLDQLDTMKKNLQKKLQTLRNQNDSNNKKGVDCVKYLQKSMKNLKQSTNKKLNKIINKGSQKINKYNQVMQEWSKIYEKSYNTIEKCSKSKFISQQYKVMQQQLNQTLSKSIKIKQDLKETMKWVNQLKNKQNCIEPQFQQFTFNIFDFKQQSKDQEYFYTNKIVTKQGLKFRLKIYPKGVKTIQNQSTRLESLTKKGIKSERKAKQQSYLGLFIQYSGGPIQKTKQRHQLVLIKQSYQISKQQNIQFSRQFQSQFDIDQCWGYEHFIKLTRLFEEGYYDRSSDMIQIKLRIAPASYYQATIDQHAFLCEISQKIKNADQIIYKLNQNSTSHSISSQLSPRLPVSPRLKLVDI